MPQPMSSGLPNVPIGTPKLLSALRLVVRQQFVAHRRFDHAGMYAIAAHLPALAPAMEGDRLRELAHRTLAHAVGREMRRTDEAGDRREVDDRAAASVANERRGQLATEKHALDVRREHAADAGDILVLDRCVHFAENAGIVDEAVQLAVPRHDLCEEDALPIRFRRRVVFEERVALAGELAGFDAASLLDVGADDGRVLLGGEDGGGRPIPDPAPVINTTFPLSRPISGLPLACPKSGAASPHWQQISAEAAVSSRWSTGKRHRRHDVPLACPCSGLVSRTPRKVRSFPLTFRVRSAMSSRFRRDDGSEDDGESCADWSRRDGLPDGGAHPQEG